MKDNQLEIKAERALYWLENGAQPTETVRALLRQQGLLKTHHEKKVAARKALDAAKKG
jgi:small subunit ribosomal protein S16